MANSESEEFLSYAKELIRSTKGGQVDWQKLNPTTYSWNAPGTPAGRFQIQKVANAHAPGQPGTFTYYFSAFEMPSNASRLAINSNEYADLSDVLTKLFDTIASSVSRRGLDFLRTHLPQRNDQQPDS